MTNGYHLEGDAVGRLGHRGEGWRHVATWRERRFSVQGSPLGPMNVDSMARGDREGGHRYQRYRDPDRAES